jgi:antitoxin component YwqK of YwqJK toxin-antitoxin module
MERILPEMYNLLNFSNKMKRIVIGAFVLFLFGCNEREHVIKYHEQGWKIEEGYLKDGKKQGRWITFDSEKDTTFIEVYESGELFEEYEYHNNIKWRKTEYKDGKEHGNEIVYFPNGEIECEGEMANGKLEGKYVCYNNNGSINQIAYYKNGVPNKYLEYHSNGKIKITADSMGNGLHKIFDTTGVLLYKVNFEDFKPKDTIYNRNIANPSESKNSN